MRWDKIIKKLNVIGKIMLAFTKKYSVFTHFLRTHSSEIKKKNSYDIDQSVCHVGEITFVEDIKFSEIFKKFMN